MPRPLRGSLPIPPLATWRALLLHPPHATIGALERQLTRLGLAVSVAWPALAGSDAEADVVFFDADTAHEGQFPWSPGPAPMALIALIGSEAPGRIEHALMLGANAHLLKPIGAAGVYSALLIAAHGFAASRRLEAEIAGLRDRLKQRPQVMAALMAMMNGGLDEETAMQTLRRMAMDRQVTIEAMAADVVAKAGRGRQIGAR